MAEMAARSDAEMKLRTFFLILFAMLAVFAFLIWQRLSINVEAEIKSLADGINAEAPIERNPHTDIIGARAEGTEFIQLIRVHGLSIETMERNREMLRANKIEFAKQDENIARLLKSGARLTYEYFVGDELAVSFSIEHEET